MEKLEPVLKQKFWILLGIAILMTFIGWGMATAKMSAEIDTRKAEIEKSFNAVPSGAIPNESWAKQLSVVNAEQERSIKATNVALWKRQLAKMTWPQGVGPVNGGEEPPNGYWGKFPNDKRDVFRESFVDNIIHVWKMVNPMDEEAGTGVVKFSLNDMLNVIGKGPWTRSPPDSDTMWEIQEDLWLLEGLFQTITSLNGGPESGRAEAIIHEITKLQLRGGGEKIKVDMGGGADAMAGGASGMTMGSMGGTGSMGMTMPGGSGGPRDTGGTGALGGLTAVSAEFDPIEEFGDDGSTIAGGGGSMAGFGAMASMASMGGMSGADASATGAAPKPISRYVLPKDQSKPRETGPYRTRGFYLSVKMDHTKIPLLIEELSSNDKSVWPIEILRVQMSRLNEDSESSFSGSSGGSAAGRARYNSAMSAPSMSGAMQAMSSAMPSGFNMGGTSGSGVLNEDRLTAFGIRMPVGDATSPQALNAKASFENALKDPVMAQVTICGVFTLYNKVEDVAEPAAAPAATPNSEEMAPAESNLSDAEGKSPTAADNPSGTPETTEPAVPTDAPADQTDTPAIKTEATTEPKRESTPDGNEK